MISRRHIALVLLLICGSSGIGYAQYFSYVMEIEDTYPLLEEFRIVEGNYIIPYDYGLLNGLTGSKVLSTDGTTHEIIGDTPDLNLSTFPILSNAETTYLIGMLNNTGDYNVSCFTFDIASSAVDNIFTYSTNNFLVPGNAVIFNKDIFIFNSEDIPPDQRILKSLVISDTGELLHENDHNLDKKRSYAWDVAKAGDDVWVSLGVGFYTIFGRYSEIKRINNAGEEVLSIAGYERFYDGNSANKIDFNEATQTLVECYTIDKSLDIDFFYNNWDEQPVRVNWYNSTGELQRDILIKPKRTSKLRIEDILHSKFEDALYLYGNYTDEDESNLMNGIILKLSSIGDTIWIKEYQHEDHESFPVNINYIEEDSIGNLTALALLGNFATGQKPWIFKVNSNGCFGGNNCSDFPSNVDLVPIIENKELRVFPTLVSDVVNIVMESSQEHQLQIDLFNLEGRVFIENYTVVNEGSLNLEHLPRGIYFLRVEHIDLGRIVTKIIKM